MSLAHAQGSTCTWLSATPDAGTVAPGATSALTVNVESHCLLPGAYIGTLKFTGNGAIDGAQAVNVSLTVQPHCGLVTSIGFLTFTVVQGQDTLAIQTLSLNTTASCAGTSVAWTTISAASWLVTPASGLVRGSSNSLVSVSVNTADLVPKVYDGDLTFVFGQSTLTVIVQLTVQLPPPAVAPVMGASPLSLNFSNTQGQPSPMGQVVTITNNGSRVLKWTTGPTCLTISWLCAAPSGGTIAPGQTGQVTINVNTETLIPGNYVGQIGLLGMDSKGNAAPGSPQTILVNLVVQPPCTMSPPSSSTLSLSSVQGAASNPAAQTVLLTGAGNCVWPVTWTTSVTPTANWLSLTPPKGRIDGTGQSGSIVVGANSARLKTGTYITQVTISASDATGGAVQGSSQSFSVILTVQPPSQSTGLISGTG